MGWRGWEGGENDSGEREDGGLERVVMVVETISKAKKAKREMQRHATSPLCACAAANCRPSPPQNFLCPSANHAIHAPHGARRALRFEPLMSAAPRLCPCAEPFARGLIHFAFPHSSHLNTFSHGTSSTNARRVTWHPRWAAVECRQTSASSVCRGARLQQ